MGDSIKKIVGVIVLALLVSLAFRLITSMPFDLSMGLVLMFGIYGVVKANPWFATGFTAFKELIGGIGRMFGGLMVFAIVRTIIGHWTGIPMSASLAQSDLLGGIRGIVWNGHGDINSLRGVILDVVLFCLAGAVLFGLATKKAYAKSVVAGSITLVVLTAVVAIVMPEGPSWFPGREAFRDWAYNRVSELHMQESAAYESVEQTDNEIDETVRELSIDSKKSRQKAILTQLKACTPGAVGCAPTNIKALQSEADKIAFELVREVQTPGGQTMVEATLPMNLLKTSGEEPMEVCTGDTLVYRKGSGDIRWGTQESVGIGQRIANVFRWGKWVAGVLYLLALVALVGACVLMRFTVAGGVLGVIAVVSITYFATPEHFGHSSWAGVNGVPNLLAREAISNSSANRTQSALLPEGRMGGLLLGVLPATATMDGRKPDPFNAVWYWAGEAGELGKRIPVDIGFTDGKPACGQGVAGINEIGERGNNASWMYNDGKFTITVDLEKAPVAVKTAVVVMPPSAAADVQ